MISFSQILILIFLALLLFGDTRQIFHKVVLFTVNLKTLAKKITTDKKGDKNSTNQ